MSACAPEYVGVRGQYAGLVASVGVLTCICDCLLSWPASVLVLVCASAPMSTSAPCYVSVSEDRA
eukprot:15277005-Alexandrium_andersonii.AAC.1